MQIKTNYEEGNEEMKREKPVSKSLCFTMLTYCRSDSSCDYHEKRIAIINKKDKNIANISLTLTSNITVISNTVQL